MSRQVFGTRMENRETFLQIQRRLLQHLIRKSPILGFQMCQNTHHHMWWVRAKHPLRIRDASQDRQPEIHSSLVRDDFQRIMGQTNNDCRFQILNLTNSPTSATFACWKIRFKTEVCTCSQFLTEAMMWIKEVEMVDSVDDLKSSSSKRGIQMPIFVILDAKIASALNRIIHNTCFKKKGQSGGDHKEDRFLRGRQIAYLIYECFRVTGANDSVENNNDLFTIVLRNDDIQDFDSKCDGIFIVNDENPTWWHPGKSVQIQNTRVWETQDRIGNVWPGDSSEENRT